MDAPYLDFDRPAWAALRAATPLTLIVKLSPNVTDITEFARVAEDSGADAISLINTVVGMSVDVFSHKPRLATVTQASIQRSIGSYAA